MLRVLVLSAGPSSGELRAAKEGRPWYSAADGRRVVATVAARWLTAQEQHSVMTIEELDHIDRALTLLVLGDGNTTRARAVALQYNAKVHEARSRLASARDLLLRSQPISSETEVELSAFAVMYAGERERIVRQWGLSLARLVA